MFISDLMLTLTPSQYSIKIWVTVRGSIGISPGILSYLHGEPSVALWRIVSLELDGKFVGTSCELKLTNVRLCQGTTQACLIVDALE